MHRLIQQRRKTVGRPQLEVIDGELRLGREADIRDVSGAGLRGGNVALDLAADTAPEIQFLIQGAFQAIAYAREAATRSAQARPARRPRRAAARRERAA